MEAAQKVSSRRTSLAGGDGHTVRFGAESTGTKTEAYHTASPSTHTLDT